MILSCGDALYDLFASSTADLSFTFEAKIGGSPLNVAMGASRLGLKSGYLSKISSDMFGENLMQFFDREQIDTSLVSRSDALSTVSFVALDDAGVPAYAFYSNGTADVSLQSADIPMQLDPIWQVIHLASYSTALEPVGQALTDFVAANTDRFISYDPNIRPTVVPDMAVWAARITSLLPMCDLIKLSDEDLALVYGDTPIDDQVQNFLAAGAGLVIVTLGEGGAALWTSDEHVQVPGVQVTVQDTVGAGDTFQAATLTWLAENGGLSKPGVRGLTAGQLIELGGFATRAAAITCSRQGADLPYRHEIT